MANNASHMRLPPSIVERGNLAQQTHWLFWSRRIDPDAKIAKATHDQFVAKIKNTGSDKKNRPNAQFPNAAIGIAISPQNNAANANRALPVLDLIENLSMSRNDAWLMNPLFRIPANNGTTELGRSSVRNIILPQA